MRAMGNVLWFVLGGVIMGLAWWLVGLLAFVTIAGIPCSATPCPPRRTRPAGPAATPPSFPGHLDLDGAVRVGERQVEPPGARPFSPSRPSRYEWGSIRPDKTSKPPLPPKETV